MGLQGKLGNIGISDIAQLLHLNKKTGMLRLKSKNFSGMLFFNNGELVNAETLNNKGDIAAYELFQQQDGEFDFISTPLHKTIVLKQSLHDIVLESARQKDTIKRLRDVIPKNYITFKATIDPRIQSFQGSLTADSIRLLEMLDGTRDVDDIVDLSGFSEFKALSVITDLIDRDFVEKLDIVKTLVYRELKGFFKSEDTAFVDEEVFKYWKTKLITDNKMQYVQLRTRKGRIASLKLGKKKDLGNKVLFTTSTALVLKINEGEKLIAKPAANKVDFFDDTILADLLNY